MAAKFEKGQSVAHSGGAVLQVDDVLRLAGGQFVYKLAGVSDLYLESDLAYFHAPRFIVDKSLFGGAFIRDTAKRPFRFDTAAEAAFAAKLLNDAEEGVFEADSVFPAGGPPEVEG